MTSVAHPGLTVCDPKLIVGPIQHGGHSGGKILLISLHAYSLCLTNGEAQKFYCGFLQDLGEFIRCSWERVPMCFLPRTIFVLLLWTPSTFLPCNSIINLETEVIRSLRLSRIK